MTGYNTFLLMGLNDHECPYFIGFFKTYDEAKNMIKEDGKSFNILNVKYDNWDIVDLSEYIFSEKEYIILDGRGL
jgi:hypothetical protein